MRQRGARARIGAGLAVPALAAVLAVTGCSAQGKTQSTPAAAAPKATTSAAATPPAPTTTTAPPVTGRVANGVHTGDLRFFFLPAPEGAVPLGDPDGDPLTPVNVVGNPDEAASAAMLDRYHYRKGYSRSYSAPGGQRQVTVKLAQFGSPALAAAYYRNHHYSGSGIRPLKLDEPFPVGAQQTVAGSQYRELLADTYVGDVQLSVVVKSLTDAMPSRTELATLLEAQYQRLRTGR